MLVAQSCLTVTSWTLAHQAPLSMGFSRPEYWSGLPCPSPGDLPNPGIELRSPVLQADYHLIYQGAGEGEELPKTGPSRESAGVLERAQRGHQDSG